MRNGIMVPLDGTAFAEAALPAAIYLARRDHVPIQLVTVWESILPLYDTAWAGRWEREEHRQRHRYLNEMVQKVEKESGVPTTVEYLKGRPGEVLPPLAELNGLDLVVMSTHGRGPLARASLGSVADQVVRRGTVPVLLIRPDESGHLGELGATHPLRRILVPLDGSDVAEKALQESILTSRAEPAEITLARFLPFPLTPGERAGIEVDGEFMRAEAASAQAYLDKVAQRLSSWNCSITTRVVEDASPWTGIADFAAAQGMDLIAMSTHGRGGAARLLLGSVANRVIRNSIVPVLLIHPEKAASPWQDVERLAGQVVGMP
jgi:nucleotide-binding universal stress UspA family protein